MWTHDASDVRVDTFSDVDFEDMRQLAIYEQWFTPVQVGLATGAYSSDYFVRHPEILDSLEPSGLPYGANAALEYLTGSDAWLMPNGRQYDMTHVGKDFGWAESDTWTSLPEGWGNIVLVGLTNATAILHDAGIVECFGVAAAMELHGKLRICLDVEGIPDDAGSAARRARMALLDAEAATVDMCWRCGTRDDVLWYDGHYTCRKCEDERTLHPHDAWLTFPSRDNRWPQ